MITLSVISYFCYKNFKKSIILCLGIILATTFLVGSLLAADYMGQVLLTDVLKEVKVDINIALLHGNVSEYEKTAREIEGLDGITLVEPYVLRILRNYNITRDKEILLPKYNETKQTSRVLRVLEVYGFRQNMSLGEIKVLEGTLNLTGDNIAITKDLAENLGIKVGDKISISYIFWKDEYFEIRKINASIQAIISLESKLKKIIVEKQIPEEYKRSFYTQIKRNYIISSMNFARKIESASEYDETETSSHPNAINYWVFVDRNKLINPWNIKLSLKKLERLEVKIENICIHYGDLIHPISNNLKSALQQHELIFTQLKNHIAFSFLPVLFLAWFFALTASWISVNERRREIGLLKVRGATNKQIFTSTIIETVAVGLVGSVIGTVLGYLSTIYFVEIFAERYAAFLAPEHVVFRFAPFYFGLSVVLGCLISMFAVIIPARKILNVETGRLLQEYLEETEKEKWKPRLIWMMFILGSIKIIEMISDTSVVEAMLMQEGYPESIVLSLFLTVLFIIDLALIVLGPLFFVYSLSKIVTHYALKLQKLYSMVMKPLLGELSDIAVKSLSRKTLRTSKIIFLIAITLTFGMGLSIFSASLTKLTVKTIETGVGADIKACFIDVANETQLVENISSIEGVKGVAASKSISANIDMSDELTRLFIIDENYFNVSFIENNYLKGISIEKAYDMLRSGEDYCIINQRLSKRYGYRVGDQITITIETKEKQITINITIIGIAKVLPGIEYEIQEYTLRHVHYGYWENLVVIGYKCAEKHFNPQEIWKTYLFIDLAEGTNSTEVVRKLEKEYNNIYSIVSFDAMFQQTLRQSLTPLLVPKFFYIEFVFILIIAVLGLALITMMSVLERRREIGLLSVRGMSKRQITKIFLGEAVLVFLISFIISILSGFSIVYGLLSLSASMVLGEVFPVKVFFTVPFELYILFIISFIFFIMASTIPVQYLARKKTAEILRVHD